jgi:lysophospholipase L1-like esterase
MLILRSLSVKALLMLLAVAAALLLGEAALRVYQALRAGTAQRPRFLQFDARLGWKATANYRVRYRARNSDGAEQAVTYSSAADGFRIFGDVRATRRKLLIIGDSFTQATNVSTDETYAALLSAALDVEVFSYGGAGYGTLQELMILEDVIDTINPDIVVLQFCSNDFINNSFALESRSTINNNGLLRPFLNPSGGIFYPTPFLESASLSDLLQRSRLFKSVAARLYARPEESVELIIGRDPSHPQFQEAIAITRMLLGRFKERVGSGRTLLVFTAEGASTKETTLPAQYQAYMDVAEQTLVRILSALQIPFVAGVPDAVAAAEARGAVVKDMDGAHWNELGHKLVAEAIQRAPAFNGLRRRQEDPP